MPEATMPLRSVMLAWASAICVLGAAVDAHALNDQPEFPRIASYVEAVSAGRRAGNHALIRIGDHTFFDESRTGPQLAGLYVVAVHRTQVLIEFHYNTYGVPGASEGFYRDVAELPPGALVVVVAKDSPVRRFDDRGQAALKAIGARQGLLGQPRRTSYLCVGMKGLSPGEAVEKSGLERQRYVGKMAGRHLILTWPPKIEPMLSTEPGIHDGLMIGQTEVIYYIPKDFDRGAARYLIGIHGAGDWHRPGAMNRIAQFREVADRENVVVIAPVFSCLLNRPVDRRVDLEGGKFKDPRIVKDWHLVGFQRLLNRNNNHRSDLKLVEIFRFFQKHLMHRETFDLYGHSGGAQFVNRFIVFYPELIDRAAFSAAGTFLFPRRDKNYPWGIRMQGLEEQFGHQIEADDLKLSESEMNKRLTRLLDLQVFIIAGQEDTIPDGPERLQEIGWQGVNHIEKARNYYAAMREEHQRQIDRGHRPRNDPFRFELHELPGTGHDSAAGAAMAVQLLFPTVSNRAGKGR